MRAALAGPLRVLAERSLEAFASFESVGHRVAHLGRAEGGAAQLRALGPTAYAYIESSRCHKGVALDEIKRLLAALQAQHADVQLRALRIDPAQAGRPAFLALSEEAEASWEPLFRDIALLSSSAIHSGTNRPVLCFLAAVGGEVPEQTSFEASLLDALVAGSETSGIVRGGELTLELLTRVRGMLHQMRLAPLETYLAAQSAVLSLLVGVMSGSADAFTRHSHVAEDALAALNAAHAHPGEVL